MARSQERSSLATAIALSVLVFASGASATLIGVHDDRTISIACSGGFGGCAIPRQTATPSAPFAAFDESRSGGAVAASQDSVFTATYLAGSGSISVSTAPLDISDAWSRYDVTFDVPVATPYELTGTISWLYAEGQIGVMLFSGATMIYQQDAANFAHSGVFEPGQYRLVANASVGGWGVDQVSTYQFLLLIPEPHSALLLAGGLALLGYRRRLNSR